MQAVFDDSGISSATWMTQLEEETQQSLITMISTVKDGTATVGDVIEAAGKRTLTSFGRVTTTISGLFNKLKTVGLSAISTLANAALSMVVAWAISKVIQAVIDKLYELNHTTEILEQNVKEAKDKIDEFYSDIEKKQDKIKELAVSVKIDDAENNSTLENLEKISKKYVELKKGVNEYNNANKSLTTEKYEEYLKICNELADQYPSLVEGYDSQKNAIINLGDSVESCTNKLIEMHKAAQNLTTEQINDEMSTYLTNKVEQVNRAKQAQETSPFNAYQEELQKITSVIDEGTFEEFEGLEDYIVLIDNTSESIKALRKTAEDFKDAVMVCSILRHHEK